MRIIIALLVAMLVAALPASAAPGCPAIPPRAPAPLEARPQPLDWAPWRDRLAALNQDLTRINRAEVELVFLGDSITQGWDPQLFAQFFGQRRTLNLGITGDLTQTMLWRLQAGQWAGLRPRVVVLLVGTNNALPNARAEDIALGIAEVIRFIQGHAPQTRILLLGVLPRGADRGNPQRLLNAQVNTLIARCADGRGTVYLDVGRLLIFPDGRLSEQVAFDQLHLTMVGYAILGAAIAPVVAQMLLP